MQHQDETQYLDETVTQPGLRKDPSTGSAYDDSEPSRAAASTRMVTQVGTDTPQSNTVDSDSKKGAWSEFSFASVIASGLASVTSVLLMNRIGIGGSLIGVGVAAGASALASQIYKAVLSSSAEKLKNAAEQQAQTNESPWGQSSGEQATTHSAPSDGTRLMPHPVTLSDKTVPQAQAASGTPIAPEAMRSAAAQKQATVTRRRIVVVCLVAALAAVALVAVIVSVATQGTGLGPTYSAPAQTTTTEQTATQEESSSTPQTKAPDQNSGESEDGKDSTTTSDSSSEKTSDTTNSDSTSDGSASDSGSSSGSTSSTSTGSTSNGSTSSDSSNTSTTTSDNTSSNSSSNSNKTTTSSTTGADSSSTSSDNSSTTAQTTSSAN